MQVKWESIPHVTFISFDFVSLEELPEFFLERLRTLMLFLVLDVTPHVVDAGICDRKSPVTILPMGVEPKRFPPSLLGRDNFQLVRDPGAIPPAGILCPVGALNGRNLHSFPGPSVRVDYSHEARIFSHLIRPRRHDMVGSGQPGRPAFSTGILLRNVRRLRRRRHRHQLLRRGQ